MEIWKISMEQGEQHTRHLVLVYPLKGQCPISNTGVGYCFICSKVFQNLHSDKLINLTLSYFINSSLRFGRN